MVQVRRSTESGQLWFLMFHLSAEHFWTTLFSYQLHRGQHEDLQKRIIGASSLAHSSGHGWKGRWIAEAKPSKRWTPTNTYSLKKLLKLSKIQVFLTLSLAPLLEVGPGHFSNYCSLQVAPAALKGGLNEEDTFHCTFSVI